MRKRGAVVGSPEPVRVVFLAGIGRSGTTLIERTLGETAGVTALGEVRYLWNRGLVRHELCGCGRPLLDCPFWTRVGADAFGGWDQVDTERMAWLKTRVDRAVRVPHLATGRPRQLMREADEYAEQFERVYRAAHGLVGGVLVDSSKQVSLAWCLQRSAGIDLRVVHCVRDSRGVAGSWAKEVERPEAVSAEHRMMPRYSATSISAYWTLHNLEIEALGRRVPSTRVRYEDFVGDPRSTTRRILDLAGVAASTDHIRPSAVHLSRGHSCSGNPMRFRHGEIELVADETWRTEPATPRRRTVTALTAPLLARYGYPL